MHSDQDPPDPDNHDDKKKLKIHNKAYLFISTQIQQMQRKKASNEP